MCKVLCILHVLLSHLNLTTFLRERNNFRFPLSEEIYLVKDQVGIQRQVVSPKEHTFNPFAILVPNRELLTK